MKGNTPGKGTLARVKLLKTPLNRTQSVSSNDISSINEQLAKYLADNDSGETTNIDHSSIEFAMQLARTEEGVDSDTRVVRPNEISERIVDAQRSEIFLPEVLREANRFLRDKQFEKKVMGLNAETRTLLHVLLASSNASTSEIELPSFPLHSNEAKRMFDAIGTLIEARMSDINTELILSQKDIQMLLNTRIVNEGLLDAAQYFYKKADPVITNIEEGKHLNFLSKNMITMHELCVPMEQRLLVFKALARSEALNMNKNAELPAKAKNAREIIHPSLIKGHRITLKQIEAFLELLKTAGKRNADVGIYLEKSMHAFQIARQAGDKKRMNKIHEDIISRGLIPDTRSINTTLSNGINSGIAVLHYVNMALLEPVLLGLPEFVATNAEKHSPIAIEGYVKSLRAKQAPLLEDISKD